MRTRNWAILVLCVLGVVDLQVRAYSIGPPATMGSRNAPVRRSGVKPLQFDLSLAYGNVAVGQNLVKSQTLTTLCGEAFCFPIDYDTAGIYGQHAGDFTLISDSCSGASIGTGGSCAMSIRFTPSRPGPRTAYLYLDSTAGNAPLILTFTGAGTVQLSPDYLSQASAPWDDDDYDHSTDKIRAKGCALTSLAMALSFAGVDTDPGALNALLLDGNGYSGRSVNWDPAVRAASEGALRFYQRRRTWDDPAAEEFLNAALAAGYPVVVGVKLNANDVPGHFVLVTGYENGQYTIQDPGYANRTTLDDYNGEYVTRGIVVPGGFVAPNSVRAQGVPGDLSGLTVAVDQHASVLVTDALGRRTGYDAGAGVEREEIPASAHFHEGLEDDLDLSPPSQFSDSVGVFQPASGTYAVKLSGLTEGTFNVTVHPFRSDGSSPGFAKFPGISGSGGTFALQVQLSVAPGGTSTLLRQASFAGTLQHVTACRAQGLITKAKVAKTLTQAITKAAAARKPGPRKTALKQYMTALVKNARFIAPIAGQILQQDGAALQGGFIVP